MGQVRWSKKAVSQLEGAIKYITEEQSPTYAKLILSRILNSTSYLEKHPRTGAKEPILEHRNKEYRFLVIWSYKVIYKVHPNGDVLIARVFHTAQNPSKVTR
jgi:plasmid stabilization system protein ParE